MQGIKKIIGFVFKYGAIAWVAALFVWYLIVSTLRQGISCDEGYYLMGYLRSQNIEGIGTDFHSIVRAICRPFADDNIMVFRYLRLILNGLAIIVFAGSSYEWLSRKKGLRISRWAYYPMVLLAGAMSFTFAAPTISYDSIELIIVLLTASLSFMLFTTDKNVVKSICAFGIGFLLWFACTNYPPAGACMVALFVLAYSLEASNKRWSHLVMAILGVLLAMVVNHFFIHDLKDWLSGISKVFVSTFTEESKSRHDAGSLISVMLGTVAKVLLVFLPMVVLFTFLYKKIRLSEKILWGIVLLICVVLIVFRRIYELRGFLFPIPVALILAKVLAQPEFKLKQFLLSKEAFFVLVLIAIPFAGVFGTNQPILKKVIMYVPFWLVAFCYLSSQLRTESNERLDLLFVVLLLAGYVWLGNFQRYHYYYTPRSSRYEIVGASRPQKVLVSQYQQQYYSDLMDTLKTAGCKPGDKFMAFGENQIAVYLAGGVIDGLLPYHWWQYKTFAKDAPLAFVLFKTEEESVIDYFRRTEWNFPENYKRMEMRPISQNMGDDYRTVVYTRLTH